jgi:hypothetical protein
MKKQCLTKPDLAITNSSIKKEIFTHSRCVRKNPEKSGGSAAT